MGAIVSALAFPNPPREGPDSSSDVLQDRPDLVWLKTASRERIPAIYIQRRDTPLTLLYSHGNAEDLGLILPYLDYMSEQCQCSVFCYEYPGYGMATGSEADEELCYEAIRAAYLYLQDQHFKKPQDIVLFGRSLGSGPTVDLAATLPDLAGCVLQSPLESGIRAFLGTAASFALYYLDIFRSYEKIRKISCPVFIMHGENDTVVPCRNGQNLYAALQERPHHNKVDYEPLWIAGRGHNDMPEYECLMSIRVFLEWVQDEGFYPRKK